MILRKSPRILLDPQPCFWDLKLYWWVLCPTILFYCWTCLLEFMTRYKRDLILINHMWIVFLFGFYLMTFIKIFFLFLVTKRETRRTVANIFLEIEVLNNTYTKIFLRKLFCLMCFRFRVFDQSHHFHFSLSAFHSLWRLRNYWILTLSFWLANLERKLRLYFLVYSLRLSNCCGNSILSAKIDIIKFKVVRTSFYLYICSNPISVNNLSL